MKTTTSRAFENLSYQVKNILEIQAVQALYHNRVLTDMQREALLWRLRMVNPEMFRHLDRGEVYYAYTDEDRHWEVPDSGYEK